MAATSKKLSNSGKRLHVSVGTAALSGRSASPSVIVIGGGIAGLSAARALHNASFKVTLLESRDWVGGRIHTDYSFGFPVDMGASWLHGACEKNPLAPLIGRLRLPLYQTSGDNSVLYDHDLESYALFDTDGYQVPTEVVTRVGETFEHILDEVRQLRFELKDDISIQKAFSVILERRPDLRVTGLAQKVMQWYMCRMEGWFAADADNISLRFWAEEELLEGGHGLMVNGYGPVVLALSRNMDILCKHRVTKICRKPDGFHVQTENGKTFYADAVVITVPLGVLKSGRIKFEPRLPTWKEVAVKDMGVGKENKIALRFRHVCWPNVEFLGIVASTSYDCSYFLNLHKVTGHPVLVFMPAGRLAVDLEKVSDEEAVNFAVKQLKKILPNATEPIQYLVSHWGVDVNTLGSYSYCDVGKPPDLYERLRMPVGNLFFAGEATSMKYPGTVHGAFLTGLMAAEDCRRLFMEQYGDLVSFQPVMAQEARLEPLLISRM